MKGIALLLTLALFAKAHAKCPEFAAVAELNLTEYAGDWVIHGFGLRMNDFEGDLDSLQCLHINLTSDDWTKEPVSVRGVIHGEDTAYDAPFEESYFSEIPSLANPAKWTVDINGPIFDHTVVDTNYEYAFTASCYSVTETDNAYVFLFKSRFTKRMPQEVIDNYRNLLETTYSVGKTDVYSYYDVRQSDQFCKNGHV